MLRRVGRLIDIAFTLVLIFLPLITLAIYSNDRDNYVLCAIIQIGAIMLSLMLSFTRRFDYMVINVITEDGISQSYIPSPFGRIYFILALFNVGVLVFISVLKFIDDTFKSGGTIRIAEV